MKTCTKCDVEQPVENFHRDGTTRRKGACKTCQVGINARTRARLIAADPIGHRRRAKDGHLRLYYGITLETFEAMRWLQDNRCLICDQPETKIDSRWGTPHELSVDHDHVTGTVRGLLCHMCNKALGAFGDSIDRLTAAADYLHRAPT